jgi:methanogenic corrinoid protein MtbC1
MVLEQEADILSMSATMTLHERDVAALIASERLTLIGRDFAILVGGYPF